MLTYLTAPPVVFRRSVEFLFLYVYVLTVKWPFEVCSKQPVLAVLPKLKAHQLYHMTGLV